MDYKEEQLNEISMKLHDIYMMLMRIAIIVFLILCGVGLRML